MSNLTIETQNKQGGVPNYKNNLGYARVFLRHNEDSIMVDDYEGFADSYKQREQTEVSVYDNGNLIFNGTKREFFEKLKK